MYHGPEPLNLARTADEVIAANIEEEKRIERAVAEAIAAKRGCEYIMAPDMRFKGYDFRLDLRHEAGFFFEERYEVKHDKMATKTGNVAVEYFYKAEMSGILASRAEFWAFVSIRRVYVVDRNVLLKELFLEVSKNGKNRVNGGDGGQSKMLLLPMSRIQAIKCAEYWLPEGCG